MQSHKAKVASKHLILKECIHSKSQARFSSPGQAVSPKKRTYVIYVKVERISTLTQCFSCAVKCEVSVPLGVSVTSVKKMKKLKNMKRWFDHVKQLLTLAYTVVIQHSVASKKEKKI